MKENKTIKLSLSTFLLILMLIVIIIMGIYIYRLNSENTEKIVTDQTVLETDQKISELETQMNILNESIETLTSNVNNIQDQLSTFSIDNNNENEESNQFLDTNFKTGRYSYDYIEKEDDLKIELSVGFFFEQDGSVSASLPGHESGNLDGTFSILDDSTIKCIFTEYSNECSGTYNIKLDNVGEVLLNITNNDSIKISNWTKIPKLNGSNLSFENEHEFTLKNTSL